MTSRFKKKVVDLRKELEREIRTLERELTHRKELLSTLNRVEGGAVPLGRGRRRRGVTAAARRAPVHPGRRRTPTRRKSKNRDMVLEAASRLAGRFSLAELTSKIHERHPKFGGKYASGTILSVLKTSPEIRKLKRGVYLYKG